MKAQLDLFPAAKVEARVGYHARDPRAERQLGRKLRASAKGGLVNGMSKAALRRYAPERLPPITVPTNTEGESGTAREASGVASLGATMRSKARSPLIPRGEEA